LERLESQLTQLRSDLLELNSGLSDQESETFLEPAENTLGRAKTRQEALTEASEDSFPDFYDRYVSALDDLDIRLESLHETAGYIELHARQRAEDTEMIDDISEVCSEISRPLNISITVLPTIWRSYAMLPLQEKGGTIYSLFAPRHANPRQYQPLLAHELGHALIDQNGVDPGYEDRIWEIDEEWGGERRSFTRYWDEWYTEFICDACGVLAFGPAYVYAIADYLHNQRPYNLRVDHPPNALRFQFINQLAEETFPDAAMEVAHPVLSSIDEHLENQVQYKPERYESYAVQELLTLISEIAQREIDNELPRVAEEVHATKPLEEVDAEIRYRVKVNREWAQNGG
jgi:hypothetical protein